MYVAILIVHILVAFVLMAVVLMQSGKGGGLSNAFGGGGGNQTLFGGRGAVDFLGKATWVLGGLFMVTSLTLAVLSGDRRASGPAGSLIDKESIPVPAPAIPGGEGAQPQSLPPLVPDAGEEGDDGGETTP